LDQTRLGLVDDDEAVREVTDRAYWESKHKASLDMADHLLAIFREWDPQLALRYTKSYIGFAKNGRPDTFVTFHARKDGILLDAHLERSDDIVSRLEEAGLEPLDYSSWGTYRVRISKNDMRNHEDAVRDILKKAYEEAYEVVIQEPRTDVTDGSLAVEVGSARP
jgi:Domain of unknown function (DUF5655)